MIAPAWTRCNLDPRQLAFMRSDARINVVPAGRRSFKTAASKRRLVRAAVTFNKYPDGRFFATAPTQQQAKDIFWHDVKALVPDWALATGNRDRDISESELSIKLRNGAVIRIAGLDKPARIEGRDWDGGVVDEFADCRANVLNDHIMPMLVRGGYVDVVGVPAGRNHYYELVQQVKAGDVDDAAYFHWTAAEVLHLYLGCEKADRFLAAMRRQMDEDTFATEWNAEFVHQRNRAYYSFDADVHASQRLTYDPELPLVLAFDWNVAPGVCVIAQEQRYRGDNPRVARDITAVIDEIHIEKDSTTVKIANEIKRRYLGRHDNDVVIYADATGGARGSAKVQGSDLDLIKKHLADFNDEPYFRRRLRMRVPQSNPPVRARLNAVNSRFTNADGDVSMLIDPVRCKRLVIDLEGVQRTPEGDIDKKADPKLTHMSDALGYYIAGRFPLVDVRTKIEQMI